MKRLYKLELYPKRFSFKLTLLILTLTISYLGFAQDEIVLTKTVTPTPNECNQFDVNLNIEGNAPERPIEVMIVIDRSTSMNNGDNPRPIDYAKDAAISFARNIYAQNPKNKVGVVTFSNTGILNKGLTGFSNSENVIDAIGSILAQGYTNISEGFKVAANELNVHGTHDCSTIRSIVLLTDGVANAYGVNGSNPAHTCNLNPTSSTTCTEKAIESGKAAWSYTINSGTNAGTYDTKVYSIGLFNQISDEVEDLATQTIQQASNGDSWTTENTADLTGIYDQIFGQLLWAAKAVPGNSMVVDDVDPNFTIITTPSVTKGYVGVNGQQISWNMNYINTETVTLTYRVQSNNTQCGAFKYSDTKMHYETSDCAVVTENYESPNICIPCFKITPFTISQQTSCSNLIDYNATINLSGGCSGTSVPYTITFKMGTTELGKVTGRLSGTASGEYKISGSFNVPAEHTTTDKCNATISAELDIHFNDANGCVTGKTETTSTTATFDNTAPTWKDTDGFNTIDDIECSTNIDELIAKNTPTAKDNCTSPGDITVKKETDDSISDGSAGYTRVLKFSATDECGNQNNTLYTLTLKVINCCHLDVTCPNDWDKTIECSGDIPPAATTEAALEALGFKIPDTYCGTLHISSVDNPATYPTCEGTVTRTYTISDDNNNSQQCSRVFTINRSTKPAEVGGPVDISSTIECEDDAIAPKLPVVKDVCGKTLTPSSPKMGGTFKDCEGTITYTYTYTDGCDASLTYNWTYTYTVDRTTKPAEVGGPVDISSTIECEDDAVAPELPVVKDVCGKTLTPSSPKMGGTFKDCEGTITYTYTYTDGCDASLTYDWTYTYTVDRTTKPAEVGGPVDISSTIECEDDAVAPELPVVKDVCGKTLTPSSPKMGGTFKDCEGTITYTYTYTDGCDASLTYDWTYTYTVDRTTKPAEVGGPVDISSTIECEDDAVAPELPVVKDVCGKTLTPSSPKMGGTFKDCEGTITYTYTYTDGCDASLTYDWTYTYTVDRTTKPAEVGGPVDISSTIECEDDAVAPKLPVVKDVCGKTLTPSSPKMGGTFKDCEGTITYTYTYTDGCDASLTYDWTYTYTVDRTTKPAEVDGPVDISSTIECEDDAVAPKLPVVKDVCGKTLTPSSPKMGGTFKDCEGTITYTYTYTDGCDASLTYDWTYTYTVDRTTKPAEVGGPVDISSTIECEDDAVAPKLPVVKDVCGKTLTPSSPKMGGTFKDCEGTITYTYTYTDGCDASLTYDWTYTYTVDRTTKPVEVGGPVDISSTIECEDDAVAPKLPVVKDVCGKTLTPSSPKMGGTFKDCEGTITYTYTYTDGCDASLTYDWTYTYTVDRTTKPAEVGGPVDISSTIECEDDAVAPKLPVVKDVCGKILTPSSPKMGGTFKDCEGTITYTYTYTDGCDASLTYDWTYTYTVDRTTKPAEVGGPVDISSTIECEDDAVAPKLPVVKDVCGKILTPSSPKMGGTFKDCEGTITYTYTYTDGCDASLTYDWTYTYTVKDTIAPTFTTPADISIFTDANCNFDASVKVTGDVSDEKDNCSTDLDATFADKDTIQGNCEGEKVITRIWTLTDNCGNSTTGSQIITVTDNIKPVFANIPVATTISCDETVPEDPGTVTASDNCSGDVTASIVFTPGTLVADPSCPNSGIITHKWIVNDGCGNIAEATQEITVTDNVKPVFANVPAATTISCDETVPEDPGTVTASDNCSGDVTASIVFTPGTLVADPSCPNSGIITHKWIVNDGCGNIAEATQEITVTDNVKPVFANVPAATTISCNETVPGDPGNVTASDNCNGDVTASIVFTPGTLVTDPSCPNSGIITHKWTVNDGCGNIAEATQEITVTDNVKPVFANVPAATTISCDETVPGDPGTVTASDNCNGDVTASIVFTPGTLVADPNCPNSGTITHKWTVNDGCGNIAEATQEITVTDAIDPTFTTPEDITIYTDATCQFDASVEVTGDVNDEADNCSTDLNATFVDRDTVPGNCNGEKVINRIWILTDGCGNFATGSQIITVKDTIDPTFNETLPAAEITAECDAVVEADVLTASDNCNSDVPVVFTETKTDGDCANSYTLTRTWTATDDCGNETSFTQTVTVSDNTAPEVTCNDITIQLEANGSTTITVDDINGGTTDACSDIDTMFISQATFDCDNVGENEVTLIVIDECGNASTCTATVTVEEGDANCGLQPFKANDDILSFVYCPDETVSGDLDLFANDEGFTPENVNFTILTDLPEGVSVTDGNLLYANENPTEAVITFTYSVCHTVNTENCSTAEVTIQLLVDTDCDGVPDIDDLDDDDDGILDIIEEEYALDQTSLDSDGDGIVDRLDIDADNDGIVDNVEWQSTIAEGGEYDYIFPLGTDSNGDGWDDAYDPASNGITYEPWDMDLDGTPDYLDTNTDNEGEDDNVEGWDEFPNDSIADVSYIGSDTDKDGLDDAYDTYNTTTEEWAPGQNAIGSDAYLQDTDDDGVRDWRDAVDDRTPPEQFACGDPVIPNAFSPNQDGYNDYFKVMIYCTGTQGGNEERVLGDDFSDARIEIFNRWGNLVYEQERYGDEDYWGDVDAWWDGTSMNDMQVGGNQLPTATYYYILYFNDGKREPITGFVFLNN